MKNAEIAANFSEMADLLEFQGANAFRVRAYRAAARTVEDLTTPLAALAEDEETDLTELPGIGKDLAQKIVTLLEEGQIPQLEELRAQVPASVLEWMRVPGLGPKKAATLYHELKIETLDELRAACEEHRVRDLKGFGAKTETSILEGIGLAERANERIYWAEADRIVAALREYLAEGPPLERLEFAGSYRRGKETVGDLDILAVATNADQVMDYLAAYEDVSDVIGRGETKMSVRLKSALQVDLRIVPAESFGAALQYFTGSKEHNVVVRGRAKDHGLKINEYGVYRGDKYVSGETEEDVYRTIGLPWFPPELREARQEFDWAESEDLPELVTLEDIRGDLHMHTTETDGKNSLEEMVEAAGERGLKYIAITDHSQRVSMARGMDGERLRRQWEEINALNARQNRVLVLKGVEVDILEEGGLDLPDDVLSEADWIVASVHYGQNQPRDQIHRRLQDAFENPHVRAIAHPTGRLIGRRKPYDVDVDFLIESAARHGKLLELNANPMRLDLDDRACAAAKTKGVPIVISTDAHRTAGLDSMRYGILQARRAGLTKADVANTQTWHSLKKLFGK